MLLRETDRNGAIEIAEKVRLEVIGLNIEHPASDVAGHVSISLGVTTVSGGIKLFHLLMLSMRRMPLFTRQKGKRERAESCCFRLKQR